MGSQLSRFLIVLAIALCPSHAHAATTTPSHHHDEDERPVGGVISLDVCADGDRLHLLTAVRADGQPPRLQYQSSDDSGATWAAAVDFGAAQPPTIAKRGMDAQIAAAGKNLVAVWPTAGNDKMGRGPMATALSADSGRTWHAGPNPADDNLTIGHSFIDLAADARGRFHLVWLDSREGTTKGLRYARSDDAGATWSPNQTLDTDTCECCWNTIATTPAGGVAGVLYRDANPRDMAMVCSDDAGQSWNSPVPVGRFNWDITACPHVGGALAFSSDTAAHALVWTAKDNVVHGVYALNSSDGGMTFAPPTRLGPHSASRPDLCATRDGRLIATWDAHAADDTSPTLARGIYTATSRDAGQTWSTPRRLSHPARTATHPRIGRTGTAARIFWTESPPGGPTTWTSGPVGDR